LLTAPYVSNMHLVSSSSCQVPKTDVHRSFEEVFPKQTNQVGSGSIVLQHDLN
jgi:hypothetical protein